MNADEMKAMYAENRDLIGLIFEVLKLAAKLGSIAAACTVVKNLTNDEISLERISGTRLEKKPDQFFFGPGE